MLVTEGWNTTYFAGIATVTRGTPSAFMQVEGLARPSHRYRPTLLLRWTAWTAVTALTALTGWQTLGFVGVHPFIRCHSPANVLVEAPAFCFFVRKQPHRRSKHGVGRADHSGRPWLSPSWALCTLCLQRRDACEPRSRATQGVPVYTSANTVLYGTACLWTASTWFHSSPFMSIHAACTGLVCLPRRSGMPVSIVGLASCPLTSQSAIDSNCILSKPATSDLPPFSASSRCCQLNSDQVSYMPVHTYYIPGTYYYSTTTARLQHCDEWTRRAGNLKRAVPLLG